MALHQAKSEKLIFAPAGAAQNARADQFTQHEKEGGLHRRHLDAQSPIAQFHAWFAAAQKYAGPVSADSSSSSSSSSNNKTTTTNSVETETQTQMQPQRPLIAHPETCTLSTAHLPSGRVSARQVYLKELEDSSSSSSEEGKRRGGFVIYSNFGTSRKAADLATNPWASLTFWWEAMERQVRVEGKAERLTREESQRYYETRVRGSRIGAWASRQSAVLEPLSAGGSGGENSQDDDGRKMLETWVKETEDKFKDTEEIPVPEFWGGLRIVPERVEFWQGRENRLHDRFVYERVVGEDGKEGWTLERLSP
ncbi:hypothetical protein BD289DRAFT_450216 [Coniella lustricola]|uniref:pyridoxal 5'-phosphate synthase n=1 Tax=Coniella lustricola TaxID=2025994 RepID=A0A2T3AJ84_9PEZI|nr:hypothetical protein BD289DRAFT_450216 [Coniella lustricola]